MLLAIDVDGTLLRSDLTISRYTHQVLKGLIDDGHKIVLCSGRPPRSMLPFYEALGLDTPLISYNGALVYIPGNPSFEPIKATIDKGFVKELFARTRGMVTSMVAESEFASYTLRHDSYLDHYFPYKGMKYIEGPLDETLDEDPYIVLMRHVHKYDDEINRLATRENILHRHWRNSFYSELYIQGHDKGAGLQYIQDRLGISKEETLAFGDSDNDIPMLLNAKQGYLMKNHKGLKNHEGFILTKRTNDQDGLALTLKEIFG